MKKPVLIAISLAAVVSGCSSTQDYVDDVNEIQSRVTDASNSIGSDVNASQNEIIKALEAAKSEAEEAVADLEDVDVPDDAEAGHEKLVDGYEDLEKLFADVQQEVRSGGGAAFNQLRTEGAQIDKKIDSALDQINQELDLE